MDVLLEEFYGKPKSFIRAEVILADIIKKVKLGKSTSEFVDNTKALEKILENELKFKKIYINFFDTVDFTMSPNIYTFVNHYRFISNAEKKNSTMTSRKDISINVNISTILMDKFDFTPDEMMGIILHEVGHNVDMSTMATLDFAYILLAMITLLPTSIPMGVLLYVPDVNNTITSIINSVDKLISKAPFLKVIAKLIYTFIMELNNVLKYTPLPAIKALASLIYNIPNLTWYTKYSAEKYADDFATSYGYGPSMATAMNKFYRADVNFTDRALNSIPIVGNIIVDFSKLQSAIFLGIMDVHPTQPRRIRSMLDKLYRDLEDPDLDPRVKKELKKNINEYEKVIDSKILEPENKDKRDFLRLIFARMIIRDNVKYTDIRDLIPSPIV